MRFSQTVSLFAFVTLAGCGGMMGLKAENDKTAALRLDNESARRVVAIQMTRPDAKYWGPNLLDRDVLYKEPNYVTAGTTDRPKDALFLKLIPPGTYKVRATDEKGEWLELPPVTMAGGQVAELVIPKDAWHSECVVFQPKDSTAPLCQTANDFVVLW